MKLPVLLFIASLSWPISTFSQSIPSPDEPRALERIDQFLLNNPASPNRQEALLERASCFFTQSRFPEALKAFERLNEKSFGTSELADLRFRKAYCYMMLGDNAKARQLLEELRCSMRYQQDASFFTACIDYNEHKFDQALPIFLAADKKTFPGKYSPYYLCQIYYTQRSYDKAITEALTAITTLPHPMAVESQRVLGLCYYNQGDISKAVEPLDSYYSSVTHPMADACYVLGVSAYNNEDYGKAIGLLQQAIGNHSAMEQSAYLLLGQAYRHEGELSQAMMAFENAYKVDYDKKVREVAFFNYAVALSQGAKMPFARSVALLEDFLQEYPNSPYGAEAREYVVAGLMSDNDYEHALSIIEKSNNPNAQLLKAKQQTLFILGSRAYSSALYPKAVDFLMQAVDLNRDASITQQSRLWLGKAFYAMGNYEGSARQLKQYLASTGQDDGNKAIAQYDLGYALMGLQKYKEALSAFKTAATYGTLSSATRADCLNRAGDCNYYLGHYQMAQDDYQQAAKLSPEAADYATFQTAMMQGLQKQYENKIATLDRLAASHPSSGLLPRAMLEKAETFTALSRVPEAIKIYETLIKTYPGTSQARNGMLQLAITYLNAGNHENAVATYKKVITSYPSSEEARLATDDLKQIYAQEGQLNEFASFLRSIPGAPKIDANEMEGLTFRAAENDYAKNGTTAKLQSYLKQYPGGTHEATALYYVSESEYNSGNAASAQQYLQRLIQSYPDAAVSEDARLLLGDALVAQGKMEMALNAYSDAESHLSSADKLRQTRLGIMKAAAQIGKDELVVETARKIQPHSPEVTLLMAEALDRTGHTADAYKAFEELEAEMTTPVGAQAAVTHAQSLANHGKNKEAKALVEKIIASNTPQAFYLAKAYILYSDLLRKEGNNFEADEYLRSLRSNYPGKEAEIFQMIDKRLK